VLAWHAGRFFVPALDFRACTHARMHTCLFAAMVSRMHNTYSSTPVLTPAQWPAPRLLGQECATALLPRACIHLLPHRPPATHGSFASPGTQKFRKNGIIASPICPCSVTAPLAVPGSARQHRGGVSSAQQLNCPNQPARQGFSSRYTLACV